LARHGPTTQVALLTGYALSSLRTAGLIDGRGPSKRHRRPAGARPYRPLPTGRDLVEWWKRE